MTHSENQKSKCDGYNVSVRKLVETQHQFLDFNCESDTTKSSSFPRRCMDIELSHKLIDYNPTPLRQGLEETWNWYQANRDEFKLKQNYFTEGTA